MSFPKILIQWMTVFDSGWGKSLLILCCSSFMPPGDSFQLRELNYQLSVSVISPVPGSTAIVLPPLQTIQNQLEMTAVAWGLSVVNLSKVG